MNVTVNLTRKDIAKIYLRFVYLQGIVIFLIMFIIEFNVNLWFFPYFALSKILMAACVATLIILFFMLLISISKAQEKIGVIGKHEFRIDEKGLYNKSQYYQGLHQWQMFRCIKVTGSYLLLIFHNNQKIIIPKRDFTSATEFEQFVSLAQDYFQQSRVNNKS